MASAAGFVKNPLEELVLEIVAQLDLSALHARHPNAGAGRAAYDPDMLLTLLIYAYCQGVRSSRQIQQRCVMDVAFRVLCAPSCFAV